MATNFPDTTVNNPDTGRLWADGDSYPDPETGLIYYWYSPVWKTAISPTGATDAKYVEVLGDNMTGDLTLGPDGGPEVIKLDENNGEILVKNSGETTARLYNEGTLVLGKGTTTAGLQYSVGGTAGNGFLKVYGNSSTTDTSTALMIDSDRDASDPAFRVSYGGDVQMASQNGGPLAGFRNLLINGDFRVWQRGEDLTYTGTANNNFGPDRWFIRAPNSVGGSTEIKRVQDGAISKCRMVFDAPSSKAFLAQRIESQTIAGLYGKELTLRFSLENISMGTAPTPTVTILSYKADGSTTSLRAEGTPIADVNGDEYTVNFTYTTDNGTVNGLNGIGLLISININGSSAVSAGVCQFWNIQLEPGPVATPFEHRPIGTELALCQRYYQVRLANYYPGTDNIKTVWEQPIVPAMSRPDPDVIDVKGTNGTLDSMLTRDGHLRVVYTPFDNTDANIFSRSFNLDAEL